MDSSSKQFILNNLTQLGPIADRLNKYQLEKIDLENLVYFLTQFETREQIEVIIKLLSRLDLIDSPRMTALLSAAYHKVDPVLRENAFLASLGGAQDSSSVVCYQLMKTLFNSESSALERIGNLEILGERLQEMQPSAIILFDDNITSGTQLLDLFEELINGKASPEFIRKPLNAGQLTLLRQTPIRICYAIQLSDKSNDVIEKISKDFKLDIQIYTGKIDYDNYLEYYSGLLENEKQAKFARDFIREIAAQLYADKTWSAETAYDRLLGYGNLGKLTAFYYNVPKSLLPVFWKSGMVNGKFWFPLLPETQEYKKIANAGIKRDYMTQEAIKSWLSSAGEDRKPALELFIQDGGHYDKEILLTVPSAHLIEEFLSGKKKPNLAYRKKKSPAREEPFLNFVSRDPFELEYPMTDKDYDRYKKAVDDFNASLAERYAELQQYLQMKAMTRMVRFVLLNEGTKPATNATIKLSYNSSELLLNQLKHFRRPSFNLESPNINQFHSAPTYVEQQPMQLKFSRIDADEQPEPPLPNTGYSLPCRFDRVGHQDSMDVTVAVTRMSIQAGPVQLRYQITYDESATVLEGNLQLNFAFADKIGDKVLAQLLEDIKDFNDTIKRG